MKSESIPHGKTILLCDDDVDFVLQHRLQLESVGFKVIEAENRRKAEELLQEQRPDIAVVDLMMEDEDSGFTLCHVIKKRYPDLPVIIATGVTADSGFEFDAATEEERAWIKADAVLQKPIRFEQLQREIIRLLPEQ